MAEAIPVQFHKERAYEVTGLWVNNGSQKDLEAYFGAVFPIAASRYGVRPLFSLTPGTTYAGDFRPHLFLVNEWPSVAEFKAFLADDEVAPRLPARDAALSRAAITLYRVPDDVLSDINEGGLVEFAALWIKPGKQEQITDYFGKAFPIASRYGVKRLSGLTPVFNHRGDWVPTSAALNVWTDPAGFRSFIEDPALKPLIPQRDEALSHLVVLHGHPVQPGGK